MDDEQLRLLAEALAAIATYGCGHDGELAARRLREVIPTAHYCQEFDGLFVLPWMKEFVICRCQVVERVAITNGSRPSSKV